MTITHKNIIQGLYTKGVEFLAVDKNKVEALHDRRVLKFSELPMFAYKTIKDLMGNANPSMDEMEEFVFNRWGGMDDVLDIDENGNPSDPEYLSDFAPAYFDNGKRISDAEMRVLSIIHLEDKVIAERLFLSPNTVHRHFQSMFINSGISFMIGQNKRNVLALWASKKGII